MALHPGNIQGYNNEIQIAGSDAAIGHNPRINEALPIASQGDKAFQGKITSPAETVHKGTQPSQKRSKQRRHVSGETAERDGLRRTKTGPCGRWGSGWPCGALVIVSLASPEQPREAGSPQQ